VQYKCANMATQQGRLLYFTAVVSFFLYFLTYSQWLDGWRLDVYHTSTHDVALVQIYNACLKCAARGSLKIQDTKNRHLHIIAQLRQAISLQVRHISTIGKKHVKQQYLLHMFSQYGELQPTNS